MQNVTSCAGSKIYIVLVICLATMSANSALANSSEPVRMGVISLSSPAKIYQQWSPFAEYLSTKLGREVKIVIPRGFNKIKQAVEDKSVDIFYVNSYIFYKLKKEGKAKPLAQMMNITGNVNNNSIFFVRSDSGINRLQQLKGEKIAFVSPMGAGGYVAPRATLYNAGIKSKTEAKEQFTKNLTSSLHKVLLGDVKVGTMCHINYQLMSKHVYTGELKVIAKSDEYPDAVMGIRNDLPESFRNQVANIIINMDTEKNGRKILDNMRNMRILKFVRYDAKAEQTTQKLLQQGKF